MSSSGKIEKRVIIDLLKDIEIRKTTGSILGTTIEQPKDLALLGEIYRSPRFETFHYIFTKENQVVGTSAISFRLVDRATICIKDFDKFIHSLLIKANDVKADQYYLLHNHPSGDPIPSRADLNTTEKLVEKIYRVSPELKFKGHVVINSNKFSLIRPDNSWDFFPISYQNSYNLEERRAKSSFFDISVRQPAHLAAVAKEIQKSEDSFQFVGLNSRNNIQAIFDLGYEIFNVSEKRLFLKVKDWAFASGIAKIALINFREEKIPLKIRDKVIENIHDSRIILDILNPQGLSYRECGKMFNTLSYNNLSRKTYEVSEFQQAYMEPVRFEQAFNHYHHRKKLEQEEQRQQKSIGF